MHRASNSEASKIQRTQHIDSRKKALPFDKQLSVVLSFNYFNLDFYRKSAFSSKPPSHIIIIHRHFLSVMIEVYLSPTIQKSVALVSLSTSFLFQHRQKSHFVLYMQTLTLSSPTQLAIHQWSFSDKFCKFCSSFAKSQNLIGFPLKLFFIR